MDIKKIEGIIRIVNDYGVPLMEEGAKITKNPADDMVVALLKGGLPEVLKKIEGQNQGEQN